MLRTDRMQSGDRIRVLAIGLALLFASCGRTSWAPTPDGPIGPRAFAAVACLRDGMTIVGGAQPGRTEKQDVVEGSAFLGPDGWVSISDPPIEPRVEAAAGAMADGTTMVWGGSDGTFVGPQASAFTYFSNGALFDLASGTWKLLPLGPLAPRANAQIVAVGDTFVVAGGTASPGEDVDRSPQAALYSLSSDSWRLIQNPQNLGVLAGGPRLLNFGSVSVDEYDFAAEAWKPITALPEDATNLMRASTRGTVTAVATNDRVWLFDDAFVALPDLASVGIDYLGWAGNSVAVWNNTTGTLSTYDIELRTWTESRAPKMYRGRISPALCAFETGFGLWGGWIDREVVRIASDSGVIYRYGRGGG